MCDELDVGQSALLTDIAMCINYYRLFSPGLYCCVHATVQLDDNTRFCPGIIVQVNHGQFKQCEPDDCFKGPPNFVLDVFGDDMLHYELRRGCYERHGVTEYVAVRLAEPVEWIWNRLIDGKFRVIETADNELIMSTALPGLWIPSYALKHRDWWAIMGAIARGVSRVGHHDFMDTIWKAGKCQSGEVERIEAERVNTLDDSASSGQSTTCTLPSGIVAWYKAEGNADDAVGNNNGTAYSARYGPGKVGRAFQFDGAGFVRVPVAPSLDPAAITVEAWVRSSGEGTTAMGVYRYLVAKGIDPDAASYALYTGHSGGLSFFVYDGTQYVLSPDAGRGIWDAKWHHVAGTFDGTMVRLYVDGNQVGLGNPRALTINYNMPDGNDLFIGNYFWPGTWGFTGSIDELSIYNRALSDSEIQEIYSAGSAGKSNGSAPATSGAVVDL
jgi:Concanavalin A-like lectin/glucanases superfamily